MICRVCRQGRGRADLELGVLPSTGPKSSRDKRLRLRQLRLAALLIVRDRQTDIVVILAKGTYGFYPNSMSTDCKNR